MYFDNPVLLDFRATIVVGVSAILFGVDAEVNGDDYYIKIIMTILIYFCYVRSCLSRKLQVKRYVLLDGLRAVVLSDGFRAVIFERSQYSTFTKRSKLHPTH